MILELDTETKSGPGYIIMPNQAMPWRHLVRWYLLISIITLSIASYFFVQGLTLILPFSGLEILTLGYALYASAWKSTEKQVITISPDLVEVENGYHSPGGSNKFPRAWTRVVLQPPRHPWYPSRLLIRSHGLQVEVGAFLNEQERQGLAIELRNALATANHGKKDFFSA